MSDPFAKVPKRLPKIYFNDGETNSAVWFDPEIGTEDGKKRLAEAVKKASEIFFQEYFKPTGGRSARTKHGTNRLRSEF